MTKPLDSRLKALESRLSPSPELLTIVRTVVYPDGTQAEIQTLQDKKGNNWQLLPGETEHAFVERVKTEAWRNEWGVIALVGL